MIFIIKKGKFLYINRDYRESKFKIEINYIRTLLEMYDYDSEEFKKPIMTA